MCTKLPLTVTNLLWDVDLVLGISWLQLVNPLIHWQSSTMYFPLAPTPGALIGDWVPAAHRPGTVTVLYSNDQLQTLQKPEIQAQIAVIQRPTFWDPPDSCRAWSRSSASRCDVYPLEPGVAVRMTTGDGENVKVLFTPHQPSALLCIVMRQHRSSQRKAQTRRSVVYADASD